MKNGNGDGVVRKENAELEYAENFYVNGSCSRLKLLHTEILDLDNYPEVYEHVKSSLKN